MGEFSDEEYVGYDRKDPKASEKYYQAYSLNNPNEYYDPEDPEIVERFYKILISRKI